MSYTPNDNNDLCKYLRDAVALLFYLALSIFLMELATSCATQKEVISETGDSISSCHIEKCMGMSIQNTMRETTSNHLLIVTLNDKGDTVKVKEYLHEVESSSTEEKETSKSETKDSLNVKHNYVIRQYARPLSNWEQFKLDSYWYILVTLVVCVAIIIYRIVIWAKQK